MNPISAILDRAASIKDQAPKVLLSWSKTIGKLTEVENQTVKELVSLEPKVKDLFSMLAGVPYVSQVEWNDTLKKTIEDTLVNIGIKHMPCVVNINGKMNEFLPWVIIPESMKDIFESMSDFRYPNQLKTFDFGTAKDTQTIQYKNVKHLGDLLFPSRDSLVGFRYPVISVPDSKLNSKILIGVVLWNVWNNEEETKNAPGKQQYNYGFLSMNSPFAAGTYGMIHIVD